MLILLYLASPAGKFYPDFPRRHKHLNIWDLNPPTLMNVSISVASPLKRGTVCGGFPSGVWYVSLDAPRGERSQLFRASADRVCVASAGGAESERLSLVPSRLSSSRLCCKSVKVGVLICAPGDRRECSVMEVQYQSGLVTFAARSSNGVLSGGQASHAPGLVPGGLGESSEEKVKTGGGWTWRSAVSICSGDGKHRL